MNLAATASKVKDKSVKIKSKIELSVVVPFFNEEDNVLPLYEEIKAIMDSIGRNYELIFVNDGSSDLTAEKLNELAVKDKCINAVNLLRNYGQTAAMMAGFDLTQGDIIIAMDGDGQNDPAEIPKLLAELDKGYDVVSGWRSDRQDKTLTRKIPSQIANWLISKISGVQLHDYGCSLKAYRKDVIEGIKLYGEMHRFIPIYTASQGGRISEIPVNHRARLRGESKYGLNRIFKVTLDLMLVSFMQRYMTKPIYIFGGVGFVLLFLSFITAGWAIGLKIISGISFISTPLPTLSGTFFTTGVLCVLMGLLAELVMRTYYEAQGKKIYQIRKNPNGEKT
ncbi:MAG: glycosyltransferase family 2 protein [Halopseudomonas aestusnigri]